MIRVEQKLKMLMRGVSSLNSIYININSRFMLWNVYDIK